MKRYLISGAEGLVEAGAIPKLIERIPEEPDHILEVLLHTLHVCCLIKPDIALESNGLEKVVPVLEKSSSSTRTRAAIVIKDLTVDAKGRNRVLDLNAIPILLNLCSDDDEMMQAKALAALMIQNMIQRVLYKRWEEKYRRSKKTVVALFRGLMEHDCLRNHTSTDLEFGHNKYKLSLWDSDQPIIREHLNN
ncbi:radial spoke head 14 [Trichonephila clavipes]|nr:radial spoke head 14 [Trichonephila clavipes]